MNRRVSAIALCAVLALPAIAAVLALPSLSFAQDAPVVSDVSAASPPMTVTIGGLDGPRQVVPAMKILLGLTLLTLAPALLISMTSFTRTIVVLSFVKQALGTQNAPPTQVVVALSLLLTFVVMAPVAKRIDEQALGPYTAEQIDESTAFEAARLVLSDFMLRQTREADLRLFHELAHAEPPARPQDVALHLLVPAFLISELRTGFEMGFLLFLPFVLIDIIVASILTSMGMVMLPPTMLSTPLKLLLFVAIDGWALLTRSIVASFS
jgi:flagellar biosynthetic protein FliP